MNFVLRSPTTATTAADACDHGASEAPKPPFIDQNSDNADSTLKAARNIVKEQGKHVQQGHGGQPKQLLMQDAGTRWSSTFDSFAGKEQAQHESGTTAEHTEHEAQP